MHLFSIIAIAALASVNLVSAHGVLTAVQGSNGVDGVAFGVVTDGSISRTDSNRAAQADTTVFQKQRGNNAAAAQGANACGKTKAGGVNDIVTQMAAAESAGLPAMGADGTVTMTIHQVNGDGAGPYTLEVDPTGTGNSFVQMEVTQNVPGRNGRSGTKATDFTVVGSAPAGMTCTGGSGATCLVRAQNPVGPFGGCAAVTNPDAAAKRAYEESKKRTLESSELVKSRAEGAIGRRL